MLSVKRIVNTPVSSNCFVVYQKGVAECMVVDPGSSNSRELINLLVFNGLHPIYIVLTHHHFDHIWGVGVLKEHFPQAQIVCSRACAALIVDRRKNCSLYYDQVGFEAPPADLLVEETPDLPFLGDLITFVQAPGHSSGSVLIRIGNQLFTGDTLIKEERTVYKLPTGSKSDLVETLQTLERLKGQGLTVRAGHGPSFDLDSYELTYAL